jgi:hypothetical protein
MSAFGGIADIEWPGGIIKDLGRIMFAAVSQSTAVRQAVERHFADVRATVEQLAASQGEMARDIEKLQAANQEILAKMPTPPPKRPAPARKPIPTAPPSSRAPIPPHPLPHP